MRRHLSNGWTRGTSIRFSVNEAASFSSIVVCLGYARRYQIVMDGYVSGWSNGGSGSQRLRGSNGGSSTIKCIGRSRNKPG